MPFSLAEVLAERSGEALDLHRAHLNHQLVRVLQITGFDCDYRSAHGSWLTDADGQRYLDLLAGFGVFALGRNHPVLKAALAEALELDLAHLVQFDCSLLSGLLGEQLCELAGPGIERCFFANSGAEAVETAIKLARRHTGRRRILHFDHAFHGLTTGALSLNGGREFRKGFGPLLPGVTAVGYGDLDAVEHQLRKGDVAAVVVEPIQGKTVHALSAEELVALHELCHRQGTLLVADEVQTGLGRTGRMFCYQHSDVTPDIVTVAKALSGGYVPVSAALCTDDVWRSTYRSADRALVHSSTFGQNTLAMVAGLATLAVLADEDLLGNAERMGQRLREGLRELQQRHPTIIDIRGRGLMIGIEFGRPPGMANRVTWPALQFVRRGLFAQSLVDPLFAEHRILTQVAADHVEVIKLLPTLVVGEPEIRYFLDALDRVLEQSNSVAVTAARVGRSFATRAVRRGAVRG